MDFILSLLFRINQDLRDHHLVQTSEKVLLSVSGGQDSNSLLFVFLLLNEYWNWDLGCIHCDHNWRKDSRKTGYFVFQLTEQHKIPYFQVLATKQFTNEEKARKWRYFQISEIASKHNYKTIGTGHTGTDRAETMFLNLTRGSGADGLHSLKWKRTTLSTKKNKIQVIRPFLGLQRQELKTLIKQINLPLWPDTTNQEMHLTRNLIRKKIFPYLRWVLNRNIDKSFSQFTELINSESLFLDTITRKILTNLEQKSSFLDIDCLQILPIALQRRILRLFLQQKSQAMEFEELEKIRYLCLNKKRLKSLYLKKGIVCIKNDKLFFLPKNQLWDTLK